MKKNIETIAHLGGDRRQGLPRASVLAASLTSLLLLFPGTGMLSASDLPTVDSELAGRAESLDQKDMPSQDRAEGLLKPAGRTVGIPAPEGGTADTDRAGSAALLDIYLQAALANSPLRRTADLQKAGQELQMELSALEQPYDAGSAVTDGSLNISLTTKPGGTDRLISITPSAVINFHDIEAKLTVEAPAVINISTGSVTGTPKVSFQKEFGGYSPAESLTAAELEAASDQLTLERAYSTGLLGIEKSVLQSVRELLTLDRSLLSIEKSLADARLSLAQDLRTGRLESGSAAWNRRVNSITRLENTHAATAASRKTAADSFKDSVGLEYRSLSPESLPEPRLEAADFPIGNTSVLLAGISVEIARQKLADELQRRSDAAAAESTFSYLASGSYTADVDLTGAALDHQLQAGIRAVRSDLSLEAGMTASIESGTLQTPTLYITGRWTAPAAAWTEKETLTTAILENAAAVSEAANDQALRNYRSDIQSLVLKIGSWEVSAAELELQAAEYSEASERAELAFERGIGTGAAVEQARFDLLLMEFDQLIHVMDGLMLEREIRALRL